MAAEKGLSGGFDEQIEGLVKHFGLLCEEGEKYERQDSRSLKKSEQKRQEARNRSRL